MEHRPVPREAWGPLLRLARLATRPLERFLRIQASSGIVLLVAAATALLWVNSRFSGSYHAFWHLPLGLQIGSWRFERSLEWWVNDGLMVLFFFVVGMEIRREVAHGELSELRRAALPLAAALGGMVVPAALFRAIAAGPSTRVGWGVPMATDIAFAVGILALLGKRVPPALRVLLLALAVIDDLGAILVIALFYSSAFVWKGLWLACAGIAGLFLFRFVGVRNKGLYIFPSLLVWSGVYLTGVHPTIAGVIVGLLTPVEASLDRSQFVTELQADLMMLEGRNSIGEKSVAETLRKIDEARREVISPAESLIESLHPWVAFGIMPLFALANSGVDLHGASFQGESFSLAAGVALGLVLGKPLGIVVVSFTAIKLGLAKLPKGLGMRELLVLGVVAGIGFTMSIFIAQLAFGISPFLATAKLAVLLGSAAAGILALLLGRLLLKPCDPSSAMAETADEAESSTER